jgi:hypothetical protein
MIGRLMLVLVAVAASTFQCQRSAALASAGSLVHQRHTWKSLALTSSLSPSRASQRNKGLLSSAILGEEDHAVVVPSESNEDLVARVPRGGSGTVGRNAPPALPTLKQYAIFAFPCLALWVAGPLLSLVDTAFVGLSTGAAGTSSASQLAALGPATTLYVHDICVLVFGGHGECSVAESLR